MYTQRNAIGFLLSLLILLSCQTKKSNDHSLEATSPEVNHATVNILPEAAVQLAEYTDAFTKSITQQFLVIHKKKTLITARGGLKVTVDPAVLEKEDGSVVDGKIKVSIIELTNSNDLFKTNTATISDGRLLASGGSYFIGMECNGQKLRLKNGKTMLVDLPLLKKQGMELFYGERNENNDMNWKQAGVALEQQFESISFTNDRQVDNNIPAALSEWVPAKVYKSLDDPIYYYKTKMTLQQLVDTLNKNSAKVYLETISYWPKNLPVNVVLDTHYLTTTYGPRKQYVLRAYKTDAAEKEALEKRKAQRQIEISNWQPKTVAGQLQKYYAPASLTNLGWINCDRFYQKEQTETDLDLPITLHNSRIEYFIIFKSFTGLVNGRIDFNDQAKAALQKLPVGESVTVVAFAKSKGIIYQAKEDFVITRNKKLSLDFKSISTEGMNKVFGKNVRI